jgi:hypothetical protein
MVHIKFIGKGKGFYSYYSVKNDANFIWGVEQQATFEEIKKYLSTPPVLNAPQSGVPFCLYVATKNDVSEGKEHVITYVSRQLLDAEMRYQFIEKL